jgi:hypothetical protein
MTYYASSRVDFGALARASLQTAIGSPNKHGLRQLYTSLFKRRVAIEHLIGHTKSEYRMEGNHLARR